MKVLLSLAILSVSLNAQAGDPAPIDEMRGGALAPNSGNAGRNRNDPTQGKQEQARGFYSKGTLANADAFPLEGSGFTKILRPRKREYATFDMIHVLRRAVAAVQKEYPSRDRVQIGDIAAQRGGSLVPMHASHQNGLDADIAYIRADGTEQDPNFTEGFQEVFVKDDRLTGNFDMPRNWSLVRSSVMPSLK
jgi:murein endopeptidase